MRALDCMSSAGAVLLHNKKREEFINYDESGGRFIENIREDVKDISLLDVEGLGRISYQICKDALDGKTRAIIYAWLRTNINVTSAYTPKLERFVSNAEVNAELYGCITVMANACCAVAKPCRNGTSLLCFGTFPSVIVKTLGDRKQKNHVIRDSDTNIMKFAWIIAAASAEASFVNVQVFLKLI